MEDDSKQYAAIEDTWWEEYTALEDDSKQYVAIEDTWWQQYIAFEDDNKQYVFLSLPNNFPHEGNEAVLNYIVSLGFSSQRFLLIDVTMTAFRCKALTLKTAFLQSLNGRALEVWGQRPAIF